MEKLRRTPHEQARPRLRPSQSVVRPPSEASQRRRDGKSRGGLQSSVSRRLQRACAPSGAGSRNLLVFGSRYRGGTSPPTARTTTTAAVGRRVSARAKHLPPPLWWTALTTCPLTISRAITSLCPKVKLQLPHAIFHPLSGGFFWGGYRGTRFRDNHGLFPCTPPFREVVTRLLQLE